MDGTLLNWNSSRWKPKCIVSIGWDYHSYKVNKRESFERIVYKAFSVFVDVV